MEKTEEWNSLGRNVLIMSINMSHVSWPCLILLLVFNDSNH